MRAIGLDVGEIRIGVATGDTESHIAVPLLALERMSLAEDLRQLGNLAREREATCFVVGMPLSMNGRMGPQAEVIQVFIDNLRDAFPIDVVAVDERLTSVEAERLIRRSPTARRGPRVRPRKGAIDVSAAVLILQTWLDSQ